MAFKVQIELNFEDLDVPPTQEDVHDYLDQLMTDDGVSYNIILPRRAEYPTNIGWVAAGEILQNYGFTYVPVFSNDLDNHVLAVAAFHLSSRWTKVFNANNGWFSTDELFAFVDTLQLDK